MTAKSPGNHRRLVTLLLNGIAKEESKAVWSYLNFVVRTCLLLLSKSCYSAATAWSILYLGQYITINVT